MRRFSDVPLARLIGITAKRATELGAPSLKHPVTRVFSAIVATSPLANLKWHNADHSHREKQVLARLTLPAFFVVAIDHALIYTKAYTFAFQNWLISVTFSTVRSQDVLRARMSAVIEGSLVPLKIPFRKECGFDSHRPHHPR
ncbi:hypothetical protein [Novosphingobium sp.]|uniref:hypothetical protein n=1 Tax=Novosphingobium sp. TaxID=1874826 RepID=UPI0025D6C980|nr:hypothetical protein [Novosphingobium sp.]